MRRDTGLQTKESHVLDALANAADSHEVIECLNALAVQANKSVASALRAQVQVIKYISTPELSGSTFDLFFKNLKNALTQCEDEEDAYEVREKAGLMLNNFIFFTRAKIEWELAVNRRAAEDLFVHAANELGQIVCEVCVLATTTPAVGATTVAVQKISQLFFNPDEHGDTLFKKAARWMFKGSRTAKKEANFARTLDALADKLVKHRDIIGENNLIAGIYENYYELLMQYHSDEWLTREINADTKMEKAWQIPLWILGIGGALSAIVWFIRLVISLFSSPHAGWAGQQWMWTGIVLGGISLIVAAIFSILAFVEMSRGKRIKKMYHDYYTGIQEAFSEQ